LLDAFLAVKRKDAFEAGLIDVFETHATANLLALWYERGVREVGSMV
jgi:hypothetical protein